MWFCYAEQISQLQELQSICLKTGTHRGTPGSAIFTLLHCGEAHKCAIPAATVLEGLRQNGWTCQDIFALSRKVVCAVVDAAGYQSLCRRGCPSSPPVRQWLALSVNRFVKDSVCSNAEEIVWLFEMNWSILYLSACWVHNKMINYGLLTPLNNGLDRSFQACFAVGSFTVQQVLSHFAEEQRHPSSSVIFLVGSREVKWFSIYLSSFSPNQHLLPPCTTKGICHHTPKHTYKLDLFAERSVLNYYFPNHSSKVFLYPLKHLFQICYWVLGDLRYAWEVVPSPAAGWIQLSSFPMIKTGKANGK